MTKTQVLPWIIQLQEALEHGRNVYYKEDGIGLLRRVNKIVLGSVANKKERNSTEHKAFFDSTVGLAASSDINFVPHNWDGDYINLNNCVKTDFVFIDTV
jgi:hypothetical protein